MKYQIGQKVEINAGLAHVDGNIVVVEGIELLPNRQENVYIVRYNNSTIRVFENEIKPLN
jgi:hypothetical protein